MRPDQRLVEYLAQNCRGKELGIRGKELASIIFGDNRETSLRKLREVVNSLRSSGYPICAHPTFGYWWAADVEEISRSAAWFRARGLEHLKQESRLRRLGPSYLDPRQGELLDAPIQVPPLESEKYIGPPNDPAVVEIPGALLEKLRLAAKEKNLSVADLLMLALRSVLAV